MTYYTTPNIPTDLYEMPQLVPEPLANSLQKEMNTVVSVPAEPIYMKVPGIEYPGVDINYGWHAPQIDWPESKRPWQGIPLQSPDVSRSNASFTEQIQAAGKFQETLGATGFRVPLRAPGINEGY